MIVRNQKTQWMLGVAICSFVGCQTTNLSVPLTSQLGKLKAPSNNVASSPITQSNGTAGSLSQSSRSTSTIDEQNVRLVQHTEPKIAANGSNQIASEPYAVAVPREPMAHNHGPQFETQSMAPIYSAMPPHVMGSNMPYGHVATPARPLLRGKPRIHAGGAYQPYSTKLMVPATHATHAKPTCHAHASPQTLRSRFLASRILKSISLTVVTRNPRFVFDVTTATSA